MTWRTQLLGAAFAGLVASSAACGDDAVPYIPTGPTGAGTTSAAATTSGGAAMCTFMVGDPVDGPFEDLCVEDPADTACLSCTRASCCPFVEACSQDGGGACSCLLTCFLDNCDPVQCLVDCGGNPESQALIGCVTDNCIDACSDV